MTTPSHLAQRRTPKGVPGAGEFAGMNRPDSDASPLTLSAPKPGPPSPAAVAAFAQRQRLATAPALPEPEPDYTVNLQSLPKRTVNLGRGIDLDIFAGMYPEYDVFTFDEDGEVVDFDPASGSDQEIASWKRVISTEHQF
ncbi:hypothetical protein ACWGJ9_10745 [Curtobacterium citreum]